MKKVKIIFPKWSLPMVERDCYVKDENNNTIVTCNQGETIEFEVDESKKIIIEMEGFLNTPSIEVESGKTYEVSFGEISSMMGLPPKLHIKEKE